MSEKANSASIDQAQQSIVDEFGLFETWTDRYEYIIELGRDLPDLPERYRAEAYLVPGCQSLVWFNARRDGARIYFDADSDALIVRGLIALLLRVYSGRLPDEILSTPPDVFERIELGSHLSGSRANGLHAMVKRIQQFARAFEQSAGAETIDPAALH